jgi:hypothetical protein
MRVPAWPTAYMYGRRRLTRLESAIYAAVAAILVAFFADRALIYMELAEKSAMDTTISALALGINARVALDMLRGPAPVRPAWSGRNPFELAGTAPASFVGDLGMRELASLERPAWIFDEQRGELLYLPRLHRTLTTADPAGALRFRLVPHAHGLGYQLVSTSRYNWDPIE